MGFFSKLFGEPLPNLTTPDSNFSAVDDKQASTCPRCESTENTRQETAKSGDTTDYEVTCKSCGSAWVIREKVTYRYE